MVASVLMAYYHGQWAGPYSRRLFFGKFGLFPPVIRILLLTNVLIWLFIDFLLTPFTIGGVRIGGPGGVVTAYLALWPLGTNFFPWQLLTYMFLHGGFTHLLFNMLALWMFGVELENRWGSRRFLVFYTVCGLGAGVANMLVAPLIGQLAPTVGASGAVFGVLVAFGVMFPDRPVYLYFLLPVKAKYFVAVYMALELFYGVTGTSDGIAHFAHLGGAAVGLLFVLADRGILPLGTLLRFLKGGRHEEPTESRRFSRQYEEVYEAKFYDIKTGRPRDGRKDITQEEIDAILDKIGAQGYQSLTEDEKRILSEASKNIH